MAKPKPVPQNVVCSECGLAWDRHTEAMTNPSSDVCLRLLKADLLKANAARRPYQLGTANGYGFGTTWNYS